MTTKKVTATLMVRTTMITPLIVAVVPARTLNPVMVLNPQQTALLKMRTTNKKEVMVNPQTAFKMTTNKKEAMVMDPQTRRMDLMDLMDLHLKMMVMRRRSKQVSQLSCRRSLVACKVMFAITLVTVNKPSPWMLG
jgi:hypothetical protein